MADLKIFLQAASGKFADKSQKSNMVAPLKAGLGYSGRKMKPCKYSILNAKVTEVTSGNYPAVSRMAANKGSLDFWKNGKKYRKSIRCSDAREMSHFIISSFQNADKANKYKVYCSRRRRRIGVVGVSPAI